MPIAESLSELTKERAPLGAPIPERFTDRAKFHELTIRFSTVPLSHRLPSLTREVGNITIDQIINASRSFEHKQMRWQSIRLDDEGKGAANPTGWEHLYIGRGMDDTDVALRVSLLGLQAQQTHPEVINGILVGGYKSLSIDQLIETNQIINELLTQEKKDMTRDARLFREETLQDIRHLSPELTTSYYYKGQDDQIIAIGTVMLRLPPHSSMRRPVKWQALLERAHTSHIETDMESLKRGRGILDLLSHGMGSFSQGFVQLAKSSR
jgi:hypothetical protein